MKVKYISHASILVESSETCLLTDPWMHSPIYGNMLWQFPPACVGISELRKADVVYISHYHPDHFCRETINLLSPDSLYVLPRLDSAAEIAEELRKSGRNTYLISDSESYEFSDIVITCYHHENGVDSSLVINEPSTDTSIYNMNDCFHATEKNYLISSKHKNIDIGFLFYIGLGPYPGCFEDIPFDAKYNIIREKRVSSFRRFCTTADELNVKIAVPYSSDMTWFRRSDLQTLNTCYKRELTDYLVDVKSAPRVEIMESGDLVDTSDLSFCFGSPYSGLSPSELNSLCSHIKQSCQVNNQIRLLEEYEQQADEVDVNQIVSSLFPDLSESRHKLQSGLKICVQIIDGQNITQVHLIAVEKQPLRRIESQGLIAEFFNADTTLVVSFDKFCLDAVYCGILSMEDLLNSRFRAVRPFAYSELEEHFWHQLSQCRITSDIRFKPSKYPRKISSQELFSIALSWLETRN